MIARYDETFLSYDTFFSEVALMKPYVLHEQVLILYVWEENIFKKAIQIHFLCFFLLF